MLTSTSVRSKLLRVVVVTTAAALLLTGAAMTAYDLRTFRERSLADLSTQADVLGLGTAAALEFDDPQSAQDYLEFLKLHPNVTAAAIYTARGSLFAGYSARGEKDDAFPQIPEADGGHIDGGKVTLFRRIVVNNEISNRTRSRSSVKLMMLPAGSAPLASVTVRIGMPRAFASSALERACPPTNRICTPSSAFVSSTSTTAIGRPATDRPRVISVISSANRSASATPIVIGAASSSVRGHST